MCCAAGRRRSRSTTYSSSSTAAARKRTDTTRSIDYRSSWTPRAHTICPPPSVHSALNGTDRCALCVLLQVDTWIATANRRQRRGRAGRVRPGEAFYMYTKERSDGLAAFQPAEMLRVPLHELCLQIKLLAPRAHTQCPPPSTQHFNAADRCAPCVLQVGPRCDRAVPCEGARTARTPCGARGRTDALRATSVRRASGDPHTSRPPPRDTTCRCPHRQDANLRLHAPLFTSDPRHCCGALAAHSLSGAL